MNLKSNQSLTTKSFPLVSVIIPFYGNINDLVNCLNGIKNQNFNKAYEVIVVESGNGTEVKQIINEFTFINFISSNTILYPGKARNIGVRNSTADILAFIDADCYPDPNWLFEIYTTIKNKSRVVIGPILNLYPYHPIASVDNLLQFPDFQIHRPNINISHFPACNLGIAKELFLESGEFPENVPTGEDVIFSRNILKQNKNSVVFNSKLIVKHSGRRDLKSFVLHNNILGFYRGYLQLKILRKNNQFTRSFLYSSVFGLKRLVYISVRTLQWNPGGIIRVIIFFPIMILGLFAWVKGFYVGNKTYLKENF